MAKLREVIDLVSRDTTLAEDLDEDLVEFMNLREADTGVPGTIHVRTRITRHGPSVKSYTGRAAGDQQSASISIAGYGERTAIAGYSGGGSPLD